MENKELHFLSKISGLLAAEIDTTKLIAGLDAMLKEYISFESFAAYVYDSVTNTMRNCGGNWNIIEDSSEIYNIFESIKKHDFVINSKAYRLPAAIGEIKLMIKSLYIPLIKEEQVFGLLELVFSQETLIDTEFLFLIKIFASQVSLKIQNIDKYNEKVNKLVKTLKTY